MGECKGTDLVKQMEPSFGLSIHMESTTPTVNEQLAACMALLNPANPDETKFCGLVILPRLVPDPSNCPREVLHYIFEKMNFAFIKRLIITDSASNAAAESSRDDPLSLLSLHSIAVDIWASFCGLEEFMCSPQVLDKLSSLVALLMRHKGDKEYADVHTTLLQSFLAIMSVAPIPDAQPLFSLDALELFSYFLSKGNVPVQHLAMRCMQVISSRSLEVEHSSSELVLGAVKSVAEVVDLSQSELKFLAVDVLGRLLLILDRLPDGTQLASSKGDTWEGQQERDRCFIIASLTLDIVGPTFLFPHVPEKDSNQFTLILVHLACAEIRVRLEEFNAENFRSSEDVLLACLAILEMTIQSLVANEDELTRLVEGSGSLMGKAAAGTIAVGDVVLKLRGAMSETFIAMLENLVDRCEHVKEHPPDGDTALGNQIVRAVVRCLLSWIGEESEYPVKELQAAMPALVAAVGTLDRIDRENGKGMYIRAGLGPAWSNLSADGHLRPALVELGGLELILDWFEPVDGEAKPGDEDQSWMEKEPLLDCLVNCVVSDELGCSTIIQKKLPVLMTLFDLERDWRKKATFIGKVVLIGLKVVFLERFSAVDAMGGLKLAVTFLALWKARGFDEEGDEEIRELWILGVGILTALVKERVGFATVVGKMPEAKELLGQMDAKRFKEEEGMVMQMLKMSMQG
ncbi:hypothetical protein HK101_001576 [Irineochytrium annulatum]|nr:hypothetical protein HK101_001576 [Irineochytrium annulatum]